MAEKSTGWELIATCKAMSKETKRTVAIAKERATQQMYQELNTKEGKDKIYKIAKTTKKAG